MNEFKKVWGNWLVLTNEIEDEKKPGKLKVEFLTNNGEMISLAPKSYYAYCRDKDSSKDGRKGVPNWYPLDVEKYFRALYNDNEASNNVEVRSLRLNSEKQMTRTTTMRSGLTAIHVKLAVQNDRVTCKPLKVGNKFL